MADDPKKYIFFNIRSWGQVPHSWYWNILKIKALFAVYTLKNLIIQCPNGWLIKGRHIKKK